MSGVTRQDIADIKMVIADKAAQAGNLAQAQAAMGNAWAVLDVQRLDNTQWERDHQIRMLREVSVGQHPAPVKDRLRITRRRHRKGKH